MEIGAAEYRAAAEEHLRAALNCHRSGDYLSSHYLSGLAVECILRAYRWKINDAWDGRHVLLRLYKEAKFDLLLARREVTEMDSRLGLVTSRWSNSHRYTSPDKLTRHLNNVGATKNVKGNKLKQNSREMYEAAEFIVGTGVRRWTN